MTNTQKFAKSELEILAATVPDAIITPYSEEILALCEKFGRSGESYSSAPYTATAISEAIRKLLLFEPISDITGCENEWNDIREFFSKKTYQNNRCSALFKEGTEGKAYYLDAIVWKGDDGFTFTGSVYIDDKNFEIIESRQFVRFPFKPKTFYIDIICVPISKEEAEQREISYFENDFNKCFYYIVKNPKQLEKVFEYYDKK